eukprot:TRINITY_DN11798_c0_g3_i1.p2 TRINITY_DN11798_c0_g3~~TRINITY_DN11798_c0_g3_i1.p2  ORF type:complete len:296 (-),score=34.05 TRINITY_DN11798_c0_g3_i1:124-1011(-)
MLSSRAVLRQREAVFAVRAHYENEMAKIRVTSWDQALDVAVNVGDSWGAIKTKIAGQLNLGKHYFDVEFQGAVVVEHETPNVESGLNVTLKKSAQLAAKEKLDKDNMDQAGRIAILLDEPLGSPDFIELEKSLLTPPLFDDLYKVVPVVPLFDIAVESKDYPCCKKLADSCWGCWNVLSMLFYPCALCEQQCIRFCGYMMYYFCLVQSRNFGWYCCHPCIESMWRCAQPFIACCIVIGRGSLKLGPEVCGVCFGDCIGNICNPCADFCHLACDCLWWCRNPNEGVQLKKNWTCCC